MHHVGIVIASIDAAIPSYEHMLDVRVSSGPFVDPLQEARVVFLTRGEPGETAIELAEPTSETSPVAAFLKRGGGMHHICYVTTDLDRRLAALRALGGPYWFVPRCRQWLSKAGVSHGCTPHRDNLLNSWKKQGASVWQQMAKICAGRLMS